MATQDNAETMGKRWPIPSAEDIKALRTRLKLTQAAFAEQLIDF
jgi:DNA-binding transcriptional regulator YiaG